jgi:hypothetical protein
MQRLSITILLFIPLILLNSCSLEQRIALKQQKKIPDIAVLIRTNTEFYFTNSKVTILNNLNEDQKSYFYDSSIVNSDFIQYMDADYYLQQLDSNFRESMSILGLKVYSDDSIVSFLDKPKPKMIIEIVQLEVEEHISNYYEKTYEIDNNNRRIRPYIVEADINELNNGDQYLSVDIPVNTVSVNAWIKVLSLINDSVRINELLFMTYDITDEIYGFFDYNYLKEVPYYTYDVDSIEVSDLWKTELLPAQEFSRQLTNYFENTIISHELEIKTGKSRQWYWQINPKTKRLLPTHKNYEYDILQRAVE